MVMFGSSSCERGGNASNLNLFSTRNCNLLLATRSEEGTERCKPRVSKAPLGPCARAKNSADKAKPFIDP